MIMASQTSRLRNRVALLVSLLFCLTLSSAIGARGEFIVTIDDHRVVGAEICFFPADGSTVFERYFGSGDVRCLDADKVIDIPPGDWYVFATYGDSHVSAWPTFIRMTMPLSVGSYKAIEIPLEPAALAELSTLSKDLTVQQRVVLYFPSEPKHPSFILPVQPHATQIIVPVNRTFVPLLVEGSVPIRIGEPYRTTDGKGVQLLRFAAEGTDVLAAVSVDGSAIRGLGSSFVDQNPLSVTTESESGLQQTALLPIRAYPPDADLIIIKRLPSIPGGRWTLAAGGGFWTREQRALNTKGYENRLLFIDEPLVPTPAGILNVAWMRTGLAPRAEIPCGSESSSAESPISLPGLALLKCDGQEHQLPPRLVRRTACKTHALTEIDTSQRKGTTQFDGLPSGRYLVQMMDPGLPETLGYADVADGKEAQIELVAEHGMISGTVRLGGKGVHSKVRFRTGVAVSDPVTGQYHAIVTEDPGPRIVEVQLCENGILYFDVPKNPLFRNSVYDVELAEPVRVQVVDALTAMPVAKARVTAVLPLLQDGSNIKVPLLPTRSDGLTQIRTTGSVWAAVRSESGASLCVSHPQYRSKCQPLTARTDSKMPVETVRLQPADAQAGKVESLRPIAGGRIYWVSPTGLITDMTFVESDGTFYFKYPHGTDDCVIFVSKSHPLYVLPPHFSDSGNVYRIRLPNVAVRDIQVRLRKESASEVLIGIASGTCRVPLGVLSYHQAMRNLQSSVAGTRTLRIASVAETAPLVIVRGFALEEIPPAIADPEEAFMAPEFWNTFPKQLVGSGGNVIFDH